MTAPAPRRDRGSAPRRRRSWTSRRAPRSASGASEAGHTPCCAALSVRVGQVALEGQPAAVLHERVPDEAWHRAGAQGFPVKPRIGICRGGMRRVHALLAPEIHFGISAAVGGAGHRSGFRIGLRGWVSRGGTLCRRIAGIAGIIVLFRPDALHGSPSLHRCAVDREVVVRQERGDLAMRENGGHHLARHARGEKAVAVFAEHGRNPDLVVDAEPHKPAEQQVVVQLRHQMPLGADREQDLQQSRPDQPSLSDGGAAKIGMEPIELASRRANASLTPRPGSCVAEAWCGPALQDRHNLTAIRSSRLHRACLSQPLIRSG